MRLDREVGHRKAGGLHEGLERELSELFAVGRKVDLLTSFSAHEAEPAYLQPGSRASTRVRALHAALAPFGVKNGKSWG